MEIWKDVERDVRYSVSSYGKVLFKPKQRVLKPNVNGRGYLQVSLGRRNCQRVHILVALAFHGPCPPGKEVNHIDGDKANNHFSNLEYITHGENLSHAHKLGLRCAKGVNNTRAKISEQDVLTIRFQYSLGTTSYSKLGKEYGLNKTTIAGIIKRRLWSHI